ncbi:MAG: ADOP family duplicated permease [Gemmatimonadota bacterium]
MSEPVWRRIARLYGPDPRADVQEEFAHHLEERVEALIGKGMTEAAAREQALRQFGDIEGAATVCSDIGMQRVNRARWSDRLGSVAMDVGYALKAMRRLPGFTSAAVVTIALGVGANTAVFSLLHALLLQPLDAARPRELVRVYTSEGRTPRNERDLLGASSYADFEDLQRSPALAGLVAVMPVSATVRLNDAPIRVAGRAVSENFFSVLGRPLLRGGWGPAGTLEVIISHSFWKAKLGTDPTAIGRLVDVNGRRIRIAGITSPDFKGIEPSDVAVYFPFRAAPELIGRDGMLADRGGRSVRLIGRLAPGASTQSAEQSFDGIMNALATEFPATNTGRKVTVREASAIVPLELLGSAVIPTAGLVFGATVVMLAIAGVNIAAVLLARTIRRRRELAIRLSLGATRFRVIRQLVTESVTLAVAAGAVVIVLIALLPVLTRSIGAPAALQPTIDGTVLGYALAIVVGFGMLCGIVPAIGGMRSDVVESLRGGGVSDRPTKARAQRALVCAQIALSMLLLLVSGSLLGSLARQLRVDPGFDPDQLIVAMFEDPTATFDPVREHTFGQLAVERLSGMPGVASFSMTTMPPLTSSGASRTIHIPDYAEQPDEDMSIPVVISGPDFFKTLGIPMLGGRELSWSDRDTVTRVVVNRSMARKYWGDRNPVGRFVYLDGKGGRPAEVIGVAGDARFRSLSEAPQPMYAIQRIRIGGPSVLIRTRGDADALMLSVRSAMSRNDVPLLLTRLRTMEDIVQSSLVVTRAVSQALLAVGMLALLLAAVGLYGVVSYVMAGRTREFGVRLALGASPRSITRLVLVYGMRMALIGGAIGLVLGFGAIRLIGSMIFVSASYVSSASLFALVLGAVTLVACAVPAMRATASSPASALRPDS